MTFGFVVRSQKQHKFKEYFTWMSVSRYLAV